MSELPAEALPRRAPSILIERMSKALNILLAQGAAQIIEPELIDLFFTAAEHAEGGMVTISMHVPIPCPACAGAICARCEPTGSITELFSAWLALRPDSPEGTMLYPSVLLPGMKRIGFRVRFA